MSSERGNVKKGPQKHQNKFAFRHNKHSRKTEFILSLPNEGLCSRCTEQIEWKKKFRKYKPLTAPRRCENCNQKTVNRAYHHICENCAMKLEVCAKCRQKKGIINKIQTAEMEKEERARLSDALQKMSERERRTFFRQLEKGDAPKQKQQEDSRNGVVVRDAENGDKETGERADGSDSDDDSDISDKNEGDDDDDGKDVSNKNESDDDDNDISNNSESDGGDENENIGK
jgi:hypothetical protein